MNKPTKWGAIISVVCGAEVVVVLLVGGAGLAAILTPVNSAIAAVVLVIALAGAVRYRRKRAESTREPEDHLESVQ